ncbi:hypothetical protein ACEPPN_017285 [Leptodophora sp. 'Broadleaf-Isolate-01']
MPTKTMSSMVEFQGNPSIKIVKFTSPSLIADVCLKIFDTGYHVKSILLKIHSAFFRKFLDSRDKMDSSRACEDFKNSAVQIDQGGALEFNGDKGLDTKCFRILLQAVYNEPYEIADNDVLCLLVDLADYIVFCFQLQPSQFRPVQDAQSCDAAEAPRDVQQMPHPHSVAILSPRFHKLEDLKHRKLAENAYAKVGLRVGNAQKALLSQMDTHRRSNPRPKQEMQDDIDNAISMSRTGATPASPLLLPAYYRALWCFESQFFPKIYPFRAATSVTMKNCLTFNTSYVSGSGCLKDCFLCGEVRDEELPWTAAEID